MTAQLDRPKLSRAPSYNLFEARTPLGVGPCGLAYVVPRETLLLELFHSTHTKRKGGPSVKSLGTLSNHAWHRVIAFTTKRWAYVHVLGCLLAWAQASQYPYPFSICVCVACGLLLFKSKRLLESALAE